MDKQSELVAVKPENRQVARSVVYRAFVTFQLRQVICINVGLCPLHNPAITQTSLFVCDPLTWQRTNTLPVAERRLGTCLWLGQYGLWVDLILGMWQLASHVSPIVHSSLSLLCVSFHLVFPPELSASRCLLPISSLVKNTQFDLKGWTYIYHEKHMTGMR